MNLQLQQKQQDEYFMRMALSLAMRGTGCVAPNPKVGCVIVQNDKSVGWGYHRRFGAPHAEIEALKMAKEAARGGTVYVNLEPCCHHGKTPPCTADLIQAGVSRVVVGMVDPNPKVSGHGIAQLRDAGIEVCEGVLESDCRWINRGFVRSMTLNRPWVTVKAAISVDGDVALSNGESKWISAPLSRQKAHLLRAENDAILVGIGTILSDDPELTVRYTGGRSPLRVVLDSQLRTPAEANVLKQPGGCVLVTGNKVDSDRVNQLTSRGVHFINQERSGDEALDLGGVLKQLCSHGVNQLMVEGGAHVISSFLSAGFVDEFSLFIAPKLLGKGIQLCEKFSINHMEEAIRMKDVKLRQLGDDLWFEGIPLCSPDL